MRRNREGNLVQRRYKQEWKLRVRDGGELKPSSRRQRTITTSYPIGACPLCKSTGGGNRHPRESNIGQLQDIET
ncbi:hypothetical protein BOTBODRAFT_33024, partial [Botryobasidium botryosum FD-172 SS1]